MPRISFPTDKPGLLTGRIACVAALLAMWLAACSTTPVQGPVTQRPTTQTPASTPAPPRAASPALQRLADEAAALQPLAQSTLSRRFLDATRALPVVSTRTIYINEISREYFSPEEKAALPAAARAKLAEVSIDEERYYYTKYGSPLSYIRELDFAATNGVKDVAGSKILSFGYGSIGHLRLLASLGAFVTGVDPDSYVNAIYSTPRDQGAVPPASGTRRGHPGTITLAHGYWPKDPKMVERVGRGYDLILSKNTLKKGYVRPEQKIDKRVVTDLGVSDETFLKAVFNVLNPGGMMIIYNVYPKPPGTKEKYNPQADARSPWSREQFEKAGLSVLAYNSEDHAMVRNIGRALKWDRDPKGNTIDLDANLFAMVTIVERPAR